MKYQILPKVEEQIKKYQSSHQGEVPLYILVPSEEADMLMEEVKSKHNYPKEMVVTTFKGSKIIKNETLTAGDIRLSNDLPETSS